MAEWGQDTNNAVLAMSPLEICMFTTVSEREQCRIMAEWPKQR